MQIEDLGSRNGTFIDGVQIEGVRLFEPLQDLCIGATRFEILNGPDGEAPDPTVTDELALPPVAPRRATAVARRQDTVDFRPPPREPPPPSAPPRPARAHPAKDAVLERIARFLAHAETKDYYGALDVAEDAEASLITEKLNSYRAFIREATVMLGEQEPRVATAATRLQRMETVLTQGRLDFDFSRDIVRAEARWAEAKQGQGPSLETLRATWVRVHPERVKEARALAADAARLRKQGRLPDAVRKGRRALLADPFSAELRDRVEFWQNLQSAQR